MWRVMSAVRCSACPCVISTTGMVLCLQRAPCSDARPPWRQPANSSFLHRRPTTSPSASITTVRAVPVVRTSHAVHVCNPSSSCSIRVSPRCLPPRTKPRSGKAHPPGPEAQCQRPSNGPNHLSTSSLGRSSTSLHAVQIHTPRSAAGLPGPR